VLPAGGVAQGGALGRGPSHPRDSPNWKPLCRAGGGAEPEGRAKREGEALGALSSGWQASESWGERSLPPPCGCSGLIHDAARAGTGPQFLLSVLLAHY
jgi:hypothetical protein